MATSMVPARTATTARSTAVASGSQAIFVRARGPTVNVAPTLATAAWPRLQPVSTCSWPSAMAEPVEVGEALDELGLDLDPAGDADRG